MTRFEAHRFATAWIGYWEEYERTGQFADSMSGIDQDALNDADPDFRLKVVLNILGRIDNDPDNHLMQVLAAGPLEDLLRDHGEAVIVKVEMLSKTSPAFNSLLGGVWKAGMPEDVWRRVQSCRGEAW